MKKKKKENLKLCMRYSESCKLCPRNKKCEEEFKRQTQQSDVKETY